MKIVYSLASLRFYLKKKSFFITIGNFDGVHLGHRYLLSHLKQAVRAHTNRMGKKTYSIVITFDYHPRQPASGEKNQHYHILNRQEKIDALLQEGIDVLLVASFKTIRSLSYQNFLQELLKCSGWQGLVASKKLRIGYQQRGDIVSLKKYFLHLEAERDRKIQLKLVKDVRKNFKTISSSRVRQHLKAGKMSRAKKILGYSYRIGGKIVAGKQLGRKIGFPTLNIAYPEDKVLIKEGVYITRCQIKFAPAKTLMKIIEKDITYWGMTFVGVAYEESTDDGSKKKNKLIERHKKVDKNNLKNFMIETYLLNFSNLGYNVEEIVISFLKFLRNKQSFNNLENLKQALHKDKLTTEAFLRKYERKFSNDILSLNIRKK